MLVPVFMGYSFPPTCGLTSPARILNVTKIFPTDCSRWPLEFRRLEECIVFVKKIAKSFGGSIPESDLEFILESFRKNHMIGASLLAFGDKELEWGQLIPSLGFRFHCRQAIMKKIKQEETEILSTMQQKGAPRKTIKETAQLTGLTKISAFFNSKHKKSDDVLNLRDDVEFFSVSAKSILIAGWQSSEKHS